MARKRHLAWRLNTSGAILAAISLWPPLDSTAEPLTLRPEREFASAAEALEPVRWVLAQAPASAGTAPGATATQTAPPSPATAGLLSLLLQDDSEGMRLQLAPLRWRGNLGMELRLTRSLGTQRRQIVEFANADVATYVGQPWLAQVRGHLGLVTAQERQKGHPLDAAFRNENDRSVALTGGVTLSVFPNSRFPFTATIENSDSRTSGAVASGDYTNRLFALRQSYRSPLGDQTYAGALERSTLLSDDFGRDSVTSLSGSMQRHFATQRVDVVGSYARNRRSLTSDGSDVGRLTAQHSWRPTDTATLNSFGSFTFMDFTAPPGGGLRGRTRFLQLNSMGTWRRDEEDPLFVTGAMRFTDAALGGAGSGDASRTLGGNLAASYALSDELSAFASGGLVWLQADRSNELLTSQAVGTTWSPAPIRYKGLTYSWTASGSANNQTGGVAERQLSALGQASHQVSRAFELGSHVGMTLGLSQSLGVQHEAERDLTKTLTHSGSVGLRLRPNSASDAFFSLSAGDSRSRGGREENFQLLNFQATGQLQIGVFSSLSTNLTVQAFRQRMDPGQPYTFTVQRSGTVSYQHMRLFGTPRLRLLLNATFNDLQLDSRLMGDITAPRESMSRLFEQRLEYDIGRLELKFGTRFATIDGKNDRQVFLRVNRQLGFF